jgi:3-deoxy-manno-octulosonate cytidylyltransferase (CMP-KDO synthetase)
MIQLVYEQCIKAKLLDKVVVATDCADIYKVIKSIGGQAVLTTQNHENGTSICAEAYNLLQEKFDFVVNIQGDEPFIHPNQIDELCAFIQQNEVQIATQIKKEKNLTLLDNTNVVKAITEDGINALNFIRTFTNKQPIDFFYKHIGLYAFRTDIFQKIVSLEPTPNEIQQKLEQLRWLDNGFSIKLQETEYSSKSIDTPADLESTE